MPRNNRIVERPWGRRHMGGWIIQRSELIQALKKGDAVELDKVVVGARQLEKLINLLPTQDCLIRSNGRLEIETIIRVPYNSRDGHYRWGFKKPNTGYRHFMSIVHGAWLPKDVTKLVVLRPRKF